MPNFMVISNEVGHINLDDIRRIYKMETYNGSGTFQVYVEFRNGDRMVIMKGLPASSANGLIGEILERMN